MKELNSNEISQVSGGFVHAAVGAGIGLGTYAFNSWRNNTPMTWTGAGIAAGTGALTGGLGGAAIKAAGGGLAANVAWRPGFHALNQSGQYIATHR